MTNELVKVEREKNRAASIDRAYRFAETMITNPMVLGFSLAMINHAMYKTGWYESDVTIQSGGFLGLFKSEIPPEQAATNVHDSIFLMIAAATVLSSLAPAAAGISDAIGSLTKALPTI